MKKILFAVLVACTLIFSGCSKTEVKNEFGWWTDYDECLAAAKKNDKNVILLISRDGSDRVSAGLKESVFHKPEFNSMFGENFELCEIDISPELFVKANPKKDAPKEEKRDSKKYKKILDKRMRVVTTHGVQMTPTLYIATKQGYIIRDILYMPCDSVESFAELVDPYRDEIVEFCELVSTVENAKGTEKVRAIDTLYETANRNYRYQMTDLMRQVEKLDKKNETGLVGKYVLSLATSDAMDAYLARKPESVCAIYEKVAKHPRLSDDQRQQAYYAAAYVVGSNTPTPEETTKLIELLEKAIEIDANSGIGQRCTELLAQVKDFKIRQDELQKKVEAEGAQEDAEDSAEN